VNVKIYWGYCSYLAMLRSFICYLKLETTNRIAFMLLILNVFVFSKGTWIGEEWRKAKQLSAIQA
jgi:uncharacterized membrane protein